MFLTSQVFIFCVLISQQWDIKIPLTFKFIAVAFNFIIVSPFIKFSISTMCCYKIVKQKSVKGQSSDFIYFNFHSYIRYIKIYKYCYDLGGDFRWGLFGECIF
jgi:hypothetical protein